MAIKLKIRRGRKFQMQVHTVNSNLQTANVAYFQTKIQLTRFSAYPNGSPSQLFCISAALFAYSSSQTFQQPMQRTLR
jgi:hypothetical protein